jgi:hypothetical protein
MTSQPTLALDCVLRVLQPLVRLLLRNGVTYTVFAAALKRVFLQAAQQELAARQMLATDSAVSLLSGVHRRDVRNLLRGQDSNEGGEPANLGLAAQVVGRWMNDPEFAPDPGASRSLPRSGERGSFEALVAGMSSDVRPRAVLDELLRLGVVTETEDGVVLERSGFAPRQGFEEKSWMFAQNLQDHANAAVANLQDQTNFLDQAVFVDRITAESADRLRQVSLQAWKQAFTTVMAEAQTRFDADAAQARPDQRQHRARFGVYFFSEREN